MPIASNVDFIAEATYGSAQMTLGVCAMPAEKLALALNAQHTDIGDGNETT